MSGDLGGNLYFNSGRFGYSNRTPPKITNDPGKVVSWLRRMQLFLGSEDLAHTITSNSTCPVYMNSWKDRDFLGSIHDDKLVADPKKHGDTYWRRPAKQRSNKNWSLAAVFPRCGKLFSGGLCLLVIVVVAAAAA